MQLEHPYTPFLHRVRQPAQYLGGEQGVARKDWDAVDCRICLAFPDLYEVGMSHLGYKILYGIVNQHPKLLAERAYAVGIDMEAELRAHGQRLLSLESARPLCDFDVVGFSLQFELTFTNVLQMLELGGIARWAAERDETAPLVIAGGPTATHAEPVAPFFDAMLIGDGEERLPELMLTWSALRRAGVPRQRRLIELAKLQGVYVPALYSTRVDAETGLHCVDAALVPEAPLPVRRTWVRDLKDHKFPTDGPVAATETVFDRVSVEIARGCTEGCRFCQAGMIYRPVRERSPDDILAAVTQAVREGGYDEASLTSLSTADYSAIAPLVKEVIARLRDSNVAVSVSSLRAYGLAEDVLDAMQQNRTTGLTFAPEAGTQRMRDVVNKNVTEEQLMETAKRIFSRGWSKMKLYFMIGLPTEEDEDVRGIVETGVRALQVAREARGGEGGKSGRNSAQVTVSVSTHVPKPHTPFQWCAMDSQEQVVRKQQLLRDTARRSGIKLRVHDALGTWLEGVLARGDRRLAAVIATAFDAGARFDSWSEHLKLDVWRAAFAAHAIEPADFLGTLPLSARLPWSHIDVDLEDGFLAREYRKALRNRLSPPCGKAVGAFVHHSNAQEATADRRKLVCYDCGVACDLGQMRQERLDFLYSLGAKEPLAAPEATPDAALQEKSESASRRRLPMAGVDQGELLRLRLGFTKLGALAYRSHLDLVRLLPRLLRRIGLPLYYSQGFHPKPEMIFGPALSLGVCSLCEYVDVKVRASEAAAFVDGGLDRLVQQLNSAAIDGLSFVGARWLSAAEPSISKTIERAVYVAGVASTSLEELGLTSLDAIADRMAMRRQLGDLRVRREVDGVGKWVDVAAFLVDASPGAGAEALEQAGIVGALVPVRIELRLLPNGAARPSEVLQALLGSDEVYARLVRTGVYLGGHGAARTPLDLPRDSRSDTPLVVANYAAVAAQRSELDATGAPGA